MQQLIRKLILHTSRTASAHFPDGSYLDIAKIEGGSDYKAYMLSSQNNSSSSITSAKHCPFPNKIYEYWPIRSTVEQDPPSHMFKALVHAAEAALESPIESAAVAANDLTNINPALAPLALANMGVNSQDIQLAGEAIARALGVARPCSPEDEYHMLHHFLSVEYSRASTTAFLLSESCGDATVLSRLHSVELGHDAMQACRAASERHSTNTTCKDTLKAAFRQLCKDSNRFGALDPDIALEGQCDLDAVLIFGELARDEDLNAALRKVIDEVWADGDRDDFARVQDLSPDPTFAASRAMAFADLNAKTVQHDDAERTDGHDEI